MFQKFQNPQFERWYQQGAYVRAAIGPEGPYPCPYEDDNSISYKWWVKGWSKAHEEMKQHPEKEGI